MGARLIGFVGGAALIELLVETQVYVGFQGAKKFIQFLDSTLSSGITAWETNLYVALQGTAVLILPPLAFASFFKLGEQFVRRIDSSASFNCPLCSV